MTLSDDMDRIQAQADEAKAELEGHIERTTKNTLLSPRGKQESIDTFKDRYRATTGELREAAEATISVEARRLPKLRQAARAADEAHTRELLGDALASQLYIQRITEMDGDQALAEYDDATPWQRALFGFRPMGQAGGDVTLQERRARERAPEWQEAEALALEIRRAKERAERLDDLEYHARLVAAFRIK